MEADGRRVLKTLRLVLWFALLAGCAGGERGGSPAPAPHLAASQVKYIFSKAEGYFFKGLYREAIREYSSLLAVDPMHATAYRCRAAALAALRHDADALEDYRRSIELAPRDDDTWLGRGLFHFARGRYGEAIEDFERAISLDSGNAVPHLYKARACEKIGKFREAGEARKAYIHCTVSREDEASGERSPARELRALGLE